MKIEIVLTIDVKAPDVQVTVKAPKSKHQQKVEQKPKQKVHPFDRFSAEGRVREVARLRKPNEPPGPPFKDVCGKEYSTKEEQIKFLEPTPHRWRERSHW